MSLPTPDQVHPGHAFERCEGHLCSVHTLGPVLFLSVSAREVFARRPLIDTITLSSDIQQKRGRKAGSKLKRKASDDGESARRVQIPHLRAY